MPQPKKCKCKIDYDTSWTSAEPQPVNMRIIFCPLHSQAEADQEIKRELVEALKEVHAMMHMNCPEDCNYKILLAKASAK